MLFQYAQLARDAIRLVQFHPSSSPADMHLILSHQSRYFERTARYTAIWYPTTTSTQERKPLALNGRARSVPLEAYNALSAICEYHSRKGQYWIDAVCINQQDEVEQRAHLQDIGRIFSSADQVLLWLGAGDEAVGKLFSAIEKGAAPDSDQVAAAQSLAKSIAFLEVLRRPELQQECSVLLNGKYECRLKAFHDFLQRIAPIPKAESANARQSHGSL